MNYRTTHTFAAKTICFVSLMVFFVSFMAHGQKEPQYTQYMYNIGSFNPAYVGTVETPEIIGLYRAQWLDIPGAPRTMRFGVNVPFSNEKNGLGFNVVSDQLGPFTQTYVDVAYSYQVNVSDDTKLSFGLDVGGSFLNVDFNKGDFEIENEPLLNEQTVNKFYPTIGAGAFLYSDNWYAGLSIPNFLTNGIYGDEVAVLVEDKVQFNFIGGYVFDLSKTLKLKPAFMVNYLQGAPVNINISSNFLINDKVTLGASYRVDNAVSALAGFQVSSSMFVGYSYDYNTNGLGEYNNGSHEVILKFYLGKGNNRSREPKTNNAKGKPKQIDSPRFF
ncbi:type IX secretion system membrane protein PorP/SprF [Maribacter polysiphoniae]|uniref:Type IX secretion system PorP/SprF family membrane protein n=1 Tax=Maribacter polysiphoniae TaxID=429344 RepID=A0A316E4U0_9FLAO|nr:type IX secretion system membrane protein PorP/SprF [Maribacter polysiphoniae]MBD1259560.1 type IX secretion system membrane protein PorP/SprF [Maribacter polysiphoniae]PWK25125.1 type IX secretion system PorP/SprF family membrane protein [Maribacter polysiphoniae]